MEIVFLPGGSFAIPPHAPTVRLAKFVDLGSIRANKISIMQDFLYFIKTYPAFISLIAVVSGMIGVFVGHWLTLGRDRRKEFNELVDWIRPALFNEKERLSPMSKGVDKIQFISFSEVLPFWKRHCFDKAVEQYKKSTSNENYVQDSAGQVFYKDTKTVVHSIDSLLRFMKKK